MFVFSRNFTKSSGARREVCETVLYLSTTIRGIEDVAAEELKTLGARDIRVLEGKVVYRGDDELFYRVNYFSKTVNRVVVLFAFEEFEDLNNIKRIVMNSEICISGTFGVVTERRGTHDFTSIEVSAAIGEAILDKCPNAEVNLNNPDTRVWAFVKNNLFMFGIDTTGISLHRRGYRIKKHPAALNPVIAAAMIRLSRWRNGVLIDPFCGSGTIPIEAYHSFKRVPNMFRDFSFRNLPMFNEETLRKIINERKLKKSEPIIIGIDKEEKYIQYATENAHKARAKITFKRGLAQEMHKIVDHADFIVTNPPYGLRMGNRKKVFKLYEEFAEELENYFSGAIMVVITPIRKFEHYFHILEKREILYGELHARIYKLKI